MRIIRIENVAFEEEVRHDDIKSTFIDDGC